MDISSVDLKFCHVRFYTLFMSRNFIHPFLILAVSAICAPFICLHPPLGPQLDQLFGLSHHIAYTKIRRLSATSCCCLPTPMTLASGGSPMFPLVVHQPASPSIWPAVQSLRRGLSTNPGATMWCVCGCS